MFIYLIFTSTKFVGFDTNSIFQFTVYSYEDAPKVTSSYEPEFEDKIVKSIFSPMGIAEKVPEKQINAISALSGSGPAYVSFKNCKVKHMK